MDRRLLAVLALALMAVLLAGAALRAGGAEPRGGGGPRRGDRGGAARPRAGGGVAVLRERHRRPRLGGGQLHAQVLPDRRGPHGRAAHAELPGLLAERERQVP